MATSCNLVPQTYNTKGEKVDSRLAKDLLSITPTRRLGINVYTHIKELKSKMPEWYSSIEKDENGELLLSSILEKEPSFTKMLDEEKVVYQLDKSIGRFTKEGQVRRYLTYNDVKQKVDKFNNNSISKDYVAIVEAMNDNESTRQFYSPKIRRKNAKYNYSIGEIENTFNQSLNKRIREILLSKGIAVGNLTELEKKLKINGITDFSTPKDVVTGLIEMIRIMDGQNGERVLPEEFAHFAIESMGNNPLKDRALQTIIDKNLAKDIITNYDEYYRIYNGDNYKLAKEALGKLIAESLLEGKSLDNIPNRNIFERFINAIREFFKGLSKPLLDAMTQAEMDANILAANILNETIPLDIKNVATTEKFLNTEEKVSRDRKILKDIINKEIKRLEILKKQNVKVSTSLKQHSLIETLQDSLEDNSELEGLYAFLEGALENLKTQSQDLMLIKERGSKDIKQSANTLRGIRNFIYSYKDSIRLIKGSEFLDRESDNRYNEKFKLLLNEVNNLVTELDTIYNSVSLPIFTQFITPFIPEGSLTFLKDKYGKNYTVEDLIIRLDKDLGIFDRWLGAMADSADPMIQAYDQVVKKAKYAARIKDEELIKEIIKEHKLLEKAGIKDTSWMYVKDKEGYVTGKYISEIDWDAYNQAKKEMYRKVSELYGEVPVGEDILKASLYVKKWYESNKERGKPILSKYKSKEFEKLNKAQLRYYKFFKDTYSQLNKELPTRGEDDIIWVRKDLLEKFKASRNVKEGLSYAIEEFKAGIVSTVDDTHYGKVSTTKDFEGREVDSLPIYYTNKFKVSEVSTDASSALIMYASMAHEYEQMKEVVDILELGKTLLREREVTQTNFGKELSEVFKYRGSSISSPVTDKGDATRSFRKLNDLMSMQVYNKLAPDSLLFKVGNLEISSAKAAEKLSRWSALAGMSFNVLGGIANRAMGEAQMVIEAASGEFFTLKDTAVADKIYTSNILGIMGDIGSRAPINKLSLFIQKFNVLQDHEKEIKEHDLDKKNRFNRLLNSDINYFTYSAGEHNMQTRTALALSNQTKLVSPNGKKVSLFDALEVVYLDPRDKSLGAKLEVKKGYTKEDGTEFTKEDAYNFERKAYRINRKLHGTYNYSDKSAIQKMALGKLAMVFRRWMPDFLDRRFGVERFDTELDRVTIGYHRDTLRVAKKLIRGLRDNKALLLSDLSDSEKANVKRTTAEVLIFTMITMALKAIDELFDDDKDNPWLLSLLEYQLQRLYTEVGFGIPSPTIISEGYKLLQSPSATINTLENTTNALKTLWIPNWFEEVESGKYEGQSVAAKSFLQSPFAFPIRAYNRTLHPEEASAFFKN